MYHYIPSFLFLSGKSPINPKSSSAKKLQMENFFSQSLLYLTTFPLQSCFYKLGGRFLLKQQDIKFLFSLLCYLLIPHTQRKKQKEAQIETFKRYTYARTHSAGSRIFYKQIFFQKTLLIKNPRNPPRLWSWKNNIHH